MPDMAAQTFLEPVDLSDQRFAPDCEQGCGRAAAYVAKGCSDKAPVMLCPECYTLGLHRITLFITMWQRANKRIFICGDCYRPVLDGHLDTHLDVRILSP